MLGFLSSVSMLNGPAGLIVVEGIPTEIGCLRFHRVEIARQTVRVLLHMGL